MAGQLDLDGQPSICVQPISGSPTALYTGLITLKVASKYLGSNI
jgi:hypothetical protein